MKAIGLTGGIASGKSTVSAMLAEFGAPVFDADREAHLLLQKGGAAWQEIKDRFGEGILAENGDIDRKKLGEIVFRDKEQLKWLESVTHGHVEEKRAAFVKEAAKAGVAAAILDIPLLIEKNIYQKVDEVWLVYVDKQTQRQRLMARDHSSFDDADARMSAQMPLVDKLPFADAVIDNSGSMDETRQQVTKHWQAVLSAAGVR